LDLPGSKIRIGIMPAELTLSAGDLVTLSTEPLLGRLDQIHVTYADLHRQIFVGDVIVADDSVTRFTVLDIVGRDINCRADTTGKLRQGLGLHIPGSNLQTDSVSERDRQLIEFACRQDIDFVGVSFVESTGMVEAVREVIGDHKVGVISKVESQRPLELIAELAYVSDALMIDRGDLSLETQFERISLIQKRILSEARQVACPVIVATELLASMVHKSAPSRAEVSDITNAVLDGANALMLSEETAIGEFPVEAVTAMRHVADAAWEHMQDEANHTPNQTIDNIPEAIGDAIALICRRLDITKIVAVTLTGYAARVVASMIPSQPILAVTNDPTTARGFNLLRGTTGACIDFSFSSTSMEHIPRCLEELWRRGELVDQDLILVTAVSYPRSGNRMNLIETHRVSDLRESLGWA